jgi:hypothetical protein
MLFARFCTAPIAYACSIMHVFAIFASGKEKSRAPTSHHFQESTITDQSYQTANPDRNSVPKNKPRNDGQGSINHQNPDPFPLPQYLTAVSQPQPQTLHFQTPPLTYLIVAKSEKKIDFDTDIRTAYSVRSVSVSPRGTTSLTHLYRTASRVATTGVHVRDTVIRRSRVDPSGVRLVSS